jgi:protein-tyrosine phosphatase
MNRKTTKRKLLTVLLIGISFPSLTNAQLADSAQRLIKMERAANFRDVGGYRTETGKTVKWGKIYRSAEISRLTDEDLQEFRKRNITNVFDFRGALEAKAAPDKLPEGTVYTLCSAGSNNMGKDMMPNFKDLTKLPTFLNDFYGNVDSLAIRYRPLFQELLQLPANQAVLFHCTGGRDRTGIATALLLYTLGVPQHKIEEDYLASNYYLKNSNKEMFKKMGSLTDDQIDMVSKALELKPMYLQTTFKSLEKRYGSLDQFFKEGLGIGEIERKQLIDKYTQ